VCAYTREWNAAHRPQQRATGAKRRATDLVRDPQHVYRGQLLRKYGLTLDEYITRSATQRDKCAICREPESRSYRGRTAQLAVDHDHATGRIRGLLCSKCNTGLGMFRDSPESLTRAITYLELAA